MKNRVFLPLIIALLIFRPAWSYADWNGHGGGHDGHGHDGGHDGHGRNGGDHHHDGGRGRSYIGLDFALWPDNYYYNTGYYGPGDAVLVSPSIYQPVFINGTTYYLNDGTYYQYNGYGYQPVPPPVTGVQPDAVIQPPEVEANQAPTPEAPEITSAVGNGSSADVDSITINIPNKKGNYTAVTLKKSGNGYIGPQGEFYPEFPKVSQLEVIYGK